MVLGRGTKRERLKEEEKRRKNEEREQKREKAEEKERKQAEKELKQAQKGKRREGNLRKSLVIVKRLCRLPVVMDPTQLLKVFQDYLACILAFSVAANQLRRLIKQLNCHPLIQMKAMIMMIVSYVEKPFLHTTQVDHLIEWIACRSCDHWYHETCITDPVDDAFVCDLCV